MTKFTLLFFLLMSVGLLACSLTSSAKPTPSSAPTSALLFYTPPASEPNLENGWIPVQEGIERRDFRVTSPFAFQPFTLVAVRIDPQKTVFRAHYTPTEWLTIRDWATELGKPLVVVNANFFTSGGEAVGLVVADGQSYGYSLDGYGGMLEVTHHQAVRIRSLVNEPFQNERFLQVVQGFPLLIERGGQPASTGAGFDDPARRTMLAQDKQGRILIMITPLGQLTLRNAQKWLYNTADLEIDIAFGLDGGKSTGLFLNTPEGEIFYPSIDPVAVVLAVYSE